MGLCGKRNPQTFGEREMTRYSHLLNFAWLSLEYAIIFVIGVIVMIIMYKIEEKEK